MNQRKYTALGIIFVLFTFSLLVLSIVNAEATVARGTAQGTTMSGTSGTPSPTIPQQQQPLSCSNPQQCREIDEVWQRIGSSVRGSSEVWDVSTTDFGWRTFTVVYIPPAPPVVQPQLQPGVVTLPDFCFPVERESFQFSGNNFGSSRESGKRCHAGVDLFTKGEGKVIAIADGIVTFVNPSFIDPDEGCGPTGAAALLIYHPALGKTVNYGELLPEDTRRFTPRMEVVKGQYLGRATPCKMLHLEMYEGQQSGTLSWHPPNAVTVTNENQCANDPTILSTKPPKLIDPGTYITTIFNKFCGSASGVNVAQTVSLPTISATSQIPYGAKTECDIRLQGEFVLNNPSPKNLLHWQKALQISGTNGKTWIGKMAGNGINDNNNRPDNEVGRDTIIFIPCRSDLSKPVELAYYFHGNQGFNYEGFGREHEDMREVLAQIKQMSELGRNILLVYPEMLYSLNDARDSRPSSLIWDGTDSDLAQLHASVQSILPSLGLQGSIAFVSITGHSRGGAAIGRAAQAPTPGNNYLKQISVNKIIFSDAGYADWHYEAPYYNYVSTNPTVEMDLLVQDPSRTGSAHDPTSNAIRFIQKIGGSATQGWSVQCASSCGVGTNYCCVDSYSTLNAATNTPFKVLGTNVWYYPINEGHDAISERSLAWVPS